MPLNAFAPDEWEDEDSLTRVRVPYSADTVPRGDAARQRSYHSIPPVSEPTLRRARDWEAERAEEPVEEPEAETLVALPKRSPRLELDPRLGAPHQVHMARPPEPPLPRAALSPPLAAQSYGFVSQNSVADARSAASSVPAARGSETQAPAARGSHTEAPVRSSRTSETRKRVKLRNGLPFVQPNRGSRPVVPLVNGLPFVPTPPSTRSPLASWPIVPANLAPPASSQQAPSQQGPSQQAQSRQALLPSYPPVPSPLPLPLRPSQIDWKDSQDERRPARRADLGATPNGLPPAARQPRPSWVERIMQAIDLPWWAVALVGSSLVVVTLTVAFALLLDAQAPPRVLVAKLPTPTLASGELADLVDGTGTLRITSDQEGISAEIDGVDRGGLPLTMEKMDAGEHEVRLHGEGYLSQTRTVAIAAGRTLHLADVKLKLDDGEVAPNASDADAQRQARDEALARAEDRRRERAEKLAEAKRDAADKNKELAKRAAAAKKAEDAKKAEAKKAKAKEAAASGMGLVNINSLPSSKAMVDGVVVGNTPVMGMSLPAGPHSVVFVHPKYGKAGVGVNVQPGKTAVASHRFPFKND